MCERRSAVRVNQRVNRRSSRGLGVRCDKVELTIAARGVVRVDEGDAGRRAGPGRRSASGAIRPGVTISAIARQVRLEPQTVHRYIQRSLERRRMARVREGWVSWNRYSVIFANGCDVSATE